MNLEEFFRNKLNLEEYTWGYKMILTLPVSVHEEEDDSYVAVCPVFSLTGKGKTLTEALDNVKKSLELFLDDETVQLKFHEEIHNYSFPEFEFIEVVVHEKPGIHPK